MSSKPTLFILSDNRDFIEPLSCLVTRELGLSCKTITAETEMKDLSGYMLVSDRALTGDHPNAIMVTLPIRIRGLLDDIQVAAESMSTVEMIDIEPDLQLSLQHKLLSHKANDVTCALTDKESQILQVIAAAGENGVSKEVLLKEVWKIDAALDTHTLETHIYRLRKKIKDAFGSEIVKANEGGYVIK